MKQLKSSIIIAITLVLTGLPLVAQIARPDVQSSRPNVLFIAIDDLRPELNCYGKSRIISPHIDQIAAEGIVCTRAYCQVALCGPSRLSMMTGVHPDRLKNYGMSSRNKVEWREHRPNLTSLPEQFRKSGYYAIGFGKIYDNRLGIDLGYSWDAFTEGWKGEYVSPGAKSLLARAREEKKAGGEWTLKKPALDNFYTADETYTDGSNARLAVDFINLYEGEQPFFLAVGFNKPHLPFVAPKKYWDLYDRDSINLPEYPAPPEGISPYTLSPYKEIGDYINPGTVDEEKTKELRHGYFACVSYVDAQIGKLLKALEDKGELDNTIIVLWGDHGFKLGDFGEWAKATNLESDARVPLVFRFPDKAHAGSRIHLPVELTDVMPTLCDMAGLSTPESAEGFSLVPIFSRTDKRIRDFALTQYRRSGKYMGYSIRTPRWRYTEWIDVKTGETLDQELYRIDDSSLMEELNVKKEYPEELKRLSGMLHQYLATAPKYEGEIMPQMKKQ